MTMREDEAVRIISFSASIQFSSTIKSQSPRRRPPSTFLAENCIEAYKSIKKHDINSIVLVCIFLSMLTGRACFSVDFPDKHLR